MSQSKIYLVVHESYDYTQSPSSKIGDTRTHAFSTRDQAEAYASQLLIEIATAHPKQLGPAISAVVRDGGFAPAYNVYERENTSTSREIIHIEESMLDERR